MPVPMATSKQTAFILDLLQKRSVPVTMQMKMETRLKAQAVTRHTASKWIEWLLGRPKTILASTLADHVATQHHGDPDDCKFPSHPAVIQHDQSAETKFIEAPAVYRHDGEIYVTVSNKAKTGIYAKHLVESPDHQTLAGTTIPFDLVYAPGMIGQLKTSERLTLADAKQLMIKYGRCIICKHTLKAAASVEAGIGPICAKAYAA